MALKVIGAGLGRTGTLSLKFALEHLGFAKCHHMADVLADARRQFPLWEQAAAGKPDWNAIFDGFQACTDYPSCRFWPELSTFYPDAKVILSTRDPDSWFNSVSKTIFNPEHTSFLAQTIAGPLLDAAVYDTFGDRIGDREFMTQWFREWNQKVIDTIPAERLLVFEARQGWQPLCAFLGVPVPGIPYPRVNSSEDMENRGPRGEPPSPEQLEEIGRGFLAGIARGLEAG